MLTASWENCSSKSDSTFWNLTADSFKSHTPSSSLPPHMVKLIRKCRHSFLWHQWEFQIMQAPAKKQESHPLTTIKTPSPSSFLALSSHFWTSLGGQIYLSRKTSFFFLCDIGSLNIQNKLPVGVCSNSVEWLHPLQIWMRWNMNKAPEIWHVLMSGWTKSSVSLE